MNRCILVGVDARLSLSTLSALESICQLLEQDSSKYHLILLHVIPVPCDPRAKSGKPIGSISTFPPTQSQLRDARQVLWRARALLDHFGIPLESIELVLRTGMPAEELAWLAQERDVDLLVLGIHPHSHLSLLRRILLGSTAGCAAHLAQCHVLLARPPRPFGSGDFPATGRESGPAMPGDPRRSAVLK
jgi:nucleotide-binding universal stress UspA family protein